MSCVVTWTATDVATLEKAIGDGVRVVEYNDKKVEYRSLAEMLQLLALMKKQVCPESASTGRFTKIFSKHSKGLC